MLYLYDGKWDRNNCITLRAIKEIKYGVFDDLIIKEWRRKRIYNKFMFVAWLWVDGDTLHWVKVRGTEACFGRRGKIISIWTHWFWTAIGTFYWRCRSEDEERSQSKYRFGSYQMDGTCILYPIFSHSPGATAFWTLNHLFCSKWGHHQVSEATCIWAIMPDPPPWLPPHSGNIL